MLNRLYFAFIGFFACIGSAFHCAALDVTPTQLPTREQWLAHVNKQIVPFWMRESAYGKPVGNFPTFRCNNGELPDPAQICGELNAPWLSKHLDRSYTRMLSRQIYTYGAIYHLTGNEAALSMAKNGVDYLLADRRDKRHGGFISYRQAGKAGLKWTQRTAQDQSYAMLGLAFYYYLTRDPAIERVLIEEQAFIFNHYLTQAKDQLLWVMEDGDGQSHRQLELVSQLDQINAYMLLVTPLLPEPAQTKWRTDLKWLTEQMLALYHDKQQMRFYGGIHHKAAKLPNARHNDYGHTIKGYWMTYLVGRLLGNSEWISLAQTGMAKTLERASFTMFVEELWNEQQESQLANQLGEIDELAVWKGSENGLGIDWWQWAELDQAALTLALAQPHNPTWLKTAQQSVFIFIEGWFDDEYGEAGWLKQFHWKNGFHTSEHALVGYILSQALKDEPVHLYFAPYKQAQGHYTPYYYQAKHTSLSVEKGAAMPKMLTKLKASFTHIQ